MGFLARLNRLVSSQPPVHTEDKERWLRAWEVYEQREPGLPSSAPMDEGGPAPEVTAAPDTRCEFDQLRWRRKLSRVFEQLPDSQPRWHDLIAEVKALDLDPQWAEAALREEFTMLVRQVVVDGAITPHEQRRLDLARHLIGLEEAEATAILDRVAAEADQFFDRPGPKNV